MLEKDRFLMYMTVGISVAIIINSFIHKDGNLVRDLMTVLAYWMPSPMTPDKQSIYIAPPSKNNSESGF